MYKACIITFSEPKLYKIKVFIKYSAGTLDYLVILSNSLSIKGLSEFRAEETVFFHILNSFDIYDLIS